MRQSRLHQEKKLVFLLWQLHSYIHFFTVMDSLCITPHKPIYSMAFRVLLVKSCWYSCICVSKLLYYSKLCSLSRPALLLPAQADLWPMTFQGERNSQQSLKFLKDVLVVHQPRAFAFEEHAFLIFKVRFHIFFCHIQNRKKSLLYTSSISPALQPQVPFPATEANIAFDVFGPRCWPPVQLKHPCFI